MLLRKIKGRIKRFLWFYVPYDVEVKLRFLLSRKFRKKVCELRARFSHSNFIPSKKESGKKLCVVFMCSFPDAWNSMKSIYLAAKKDKNIDVYILAVPFYDAQKEECEPNNLTYEKCSMFDKDTISAYDYDSGTYFDLKSLSPDYVFISRPYDLQVPPYYRSNELKKYTKICFIDYGYRLAIRSFKMLFYRCFDFITNCSFIFTHSGDHLALFGSMLNFWHIKSVITNFAGYSRFDLFSNNIQNVSGKTTEFRKTVMWLPRWTTDTSTNLPSTFFKYKDSIIKYFLGHKDIKLICRPHPLMIRNFLSTGEMTQSDADAFMKPFHEEKNFVYDDNPDYIPAFMESDIFLSDFTSLLIEEFITEKPVIYLGRHSTLSSDAKEIASMFYSAGNESQLFRHLESLIENHDSTKQKRHEYITQKMKHDGKAGERIMQFIKEDFKA